MNKSIIVPEKLKDFFRINGRIALAFSGGCDSAYLLYAALACGARVRAYYVRSAFQPAFELSDAQRLAQTLGADLCVLDVDVLADDRVRKNPAQRCYYCKQQIFGAVLQAAKQDGFACVMDGTNASDDADDRPGMRALAEMQVLSPLRSCGIDKAQVRALSREAGLFTWNKPAYACLATRIPTGTQIERLDLARVEHAEAVLEKMGFAGFRLRLTPKGARLELTEKQMPLLIEKRADILAALGNSFDEITMDLRPRREVEA